MKTKPAFDGEIHAVSAKKMPDLNSPKREPGWFLGEPGKTNDAPAPAPSGSGVRVRAIDWEDSRSPLIDTGVYFSRAVTPFGSYSTERFIADRWMMTGPNGEALRDEGGAVVHFETLEEAKAAAQADYEARILSALASDASPRGEAVAWRWRYEGEKAWCLRKSKPDDWPDVGMQPLYAHPAPATVESDEVSVAARFNRLATICRRIKWRNVGEPAWNDKQTADALFDLAEWLFADGVDAALAPATEGRKG